MIGRKFIKVDNTMSLLFSKERFCFVFFSFLVSLFSLIFKFLQLSKVVIPPNFLRITSFLSLIP